MDVHSLVEIRYERRGPVGAWPQDGEKDPIKKPAYHSMCDPSGAGIVTSLANSVVEAGFLPNNSDNSTLLIFRKDFRAKSFPSARPGRLVRGRGVDAPLERSATTTPVTMTMEKGL